jgi:hypothetical protein
LSLYKLIHSEFPTPPLRRGSGTRKLEIAPPLAFLPLGKPGGLWKLEIALFFTSTVLKLEAGSWKLEIAPYPGMARCNSPPEAGSWKLLSGLAPNAGSWKLEIGQQISDTR